MHAQLVGEIYWYLYNKIKTALRVKCALALLKELVGYRLALFVFRAGFRIKVGREIDRVLHHQKSF